MAEINLDRHAVIEASAGTGKTYTLVELAKRLIRDRRASLGEILLVTYTEKATGDLKGRLRQALEDELRAGPEKPEAFQAALDGFEAAQVHTIHGFCQRVLHEYAFENRHDFQSALVNDADMLELCLHELQRTWWRAHYGDKLADLLRLSGYANAGGGRKWEERILDIARRFRPACGHRLLPEPIEDFAQALGALDAELCTDWRAVRKLAGVLGKESAKAACWWTGYGKLHFRSDWRDAWRERVLMPLLSWLVNVDVPSQPLSAFCELDDACREPFARLITSIGDDAEAELPRLCPGLVDAITLLDQRRASLDRDLWENLLAVATVRKLSEAIRVHKEERGLQSYEDQLTRVAEALDPARNPGADRLLAFLRARFRFAIVDEFQDTDRIQWHIFRRIFVEGTRDHRLFVVGDAKQAIFGFRGADFQAYCQAVDELKRDHGAAALPLEVNWRSCPELIDALNRLFEAGNWFQGSIPFARVQPAPAAAQRFRVPPGADETGTAALTLVDLTAAASLTQARRQMAAFVAAEIVRLMRGVDGSPVLRWDVKGDGGTTERHTLAYGDFCILVPRRREAVPVMEALRAVKIPYTFYKEPGLWQSDEAQHLAWLLSALARPGDALAARAALLTRFFTFQPQDLVDRDEFPPGHRVTELFRQWHDLVSERRWPALFQSIIEDTGLLVREFQARDAERRLANWRHLLSALERDAYAHDLDAFGVLQVLSQKKQRLPDDEDNLQPIETDHPKVRIMTIHAAKGLEFPVVFLAGGFTKGRNGGVWMYRDDQKNFVIDLRARSDLAKGRHQQERAEEDRRLFYVALTRAILKLYVPRVVSGGPWAGPLGEVVAPAIEHARLPDPAMPNVQLVQFDAGTSGEPEAPRGVEAAACPAARGIAGPLFPPLPDDLFGRRIWTRSFSSLHRRAESSDADALVDALEPAPADDEPQSAAGPEPLQGTVFGQIVHKVLEKVDMQKIDAASTLAALPHDVLDLIEAMRARYWPELPAAIAAETSQASACNELVQRLVWNALKTPLAEAGGPLCKVPKADRIHELEFLFPAIPARSVAPDASRYLTGSMDLVFRRGARFFLVDWKTNLLLEGYAPEALEQAMADMDYVRQYRIYLQALERWLRLRLGSDFDFATQFGGVYYLFLRGMNGLDETSGVFFHAPVPDDLRLGNVWSA